MVYKLSWATNEKSIKDYILSQLTFLDMAKQVKIFYPDPTLPQKYLTRSKNGLTHDPTCVFRGSTLPEPKTIF